MPSGSCSLHSVARVFGIRPRSFQRYLALHGTSFKEMLMASRRTMACRLLAETEVPIAEVGRKIGYEDASNFGRAFRSWTGRAPRAWRERVRNEGRRPAEASRP